MGSDSGEIACGAFVMDASLLYEQPFTSIHHEGLDGLFPPATAYEVVNVLERIRTNGIALEQRENNVRIS